LRPHPRKKFIFIKSAPNKIFLKKELFFARSRPPLPLIKVVKCFCRAEKPNLLPIHPAVSVLGLQPAFGCLPLPVRSEPAFPFLGKAGRKTKFFSPPISFLANFGRGAKFANQF